MNFLEKYTNKKNIRFNLFKKTLEIAANRGFKVIVETGTSRGKKKLVRWGIRQARKHHN